MNDVLLKRLELFAESFDTKNWNQLKECLSDEIFTDYSSFRKTEPGIVSKEDYVEQRKEGLKNLETIHTFKNYDFQIIGNRAKCSCDFVIKRFDLGKGDYFHSYGMYQFNLVKTGESWKIDKIIQNISKNEGNKDIHGAFK